MNTNLREDERSMDVVEREEVIHDDDLTHHERVVEDVGAEQAAVAGKVAGLIWLLTGVVEFLIGLRVLLKLIAANPNAPFVSGIYNLSAIFLWPFFGITGTPSSNGMVLEVSALIAMLVYAVLGWLLVRLVSLLLSPARSRSTQIEHYHEL